MTAKYIILAGVAAVLIAVVVAWYRQATRADRPVVIFKLPTRLNPVIGLWWPNTGSGERLRYSVAIGVSQIRPWGTIWRQSWYPNRPGCDIILAEQKNDRPA